MIDGGSMPSRVASAAMRSTVRTMLETVSVEADILAWY
jgi:hypothetical protein